ncbi:ParB/RepB/Spo0J family partition protein [Nonomuraea sp. 3-1Str]|uniref:ParB/RepB/Spo0J family partition protein n=1 Tax=Nonomuraea sp. 3-1Str TaxID=2929801 RepID=UPI002858BD39|nr:ParB/RepB/Spo0J family partition protein [Nonomuraea sp. 3-1Str]MDR8413848.1 ParB/RepB/Spo0J family partition protein [Nonomuraea sp. 3-1Str]
MHIKLLKRGDSPRVLGVDEEHVRRLAEIDDDLPPILVHRATMRVIDGMHRLGAAILNGRQTILVRFFEGSDEAAFLAAVRANTAHGMPLSLQDRRVAAMRILESHPGMSDRAVAEVAGLSAKTVSGLRRCSTAETPQLNARIGKDGRRRPLNAEEGRLRAARVIAANPDASLRKIAADAAVSVGTAHAVRQRIRRGEDPMAPRVTERLGGVPGTAGPDDAVQGAVRSAVSRNPAGTAADARRRVAGQQADALLRLRSLQRDPSLRLSEAGRHLLRWMHSHVIARDMQSELVDAVPTHLAPIVADMALQCAEIWSDFAQDVQERLREQSERTPPLRSQAGERPWKG